MINYWSNILKLLSAALLAVTILSCNNNPGTLTIKVKWPDKKAPEWNYYATGKISSYDENGNLKTLNSSENIQPKKDEKLEFKDLDYGKERFIKIEIRNSDELNLNPAFYGTSDFFTIEKGKDIEVFVTLKKHPGFSNDGTVGTSSFSLFYDKEDGNEEEIVHNETAVPVEIVKIRFTNENARFYHFSNRKDFSSGNGFFKLDIENSENIPNLKSMDNGSGKFEISEWNLSLGLSEKDLKLPYRKLFVKSSNDDGFESLTKEFIIKLDIFPPSLEFTKPIEKNSVFKSGSTIDFEIKANETLSELTVSIENSQKDEKVVLTPTYAASNIYKFSFNEIETLEETGNYFINVQAKDLVGNKNSIISNYFSIDFSPAYITEFSLPECAVKREENLIIDFETSEEIDLSSSKVQFAGINMGVIQIEKSENGFEYQAQLKLINFTDKTFGEYLVIANLVDKAGNISDPTTLGAVKFNNNTYEYEKGSVIAKNALWDKNQLSVCFERESFLIGQTDKVDSFKYILERGWIEQAVSSTWGLNSKVSFYNWKVCSHNTTDDIRILLVNDKNRVSSSFIGNNIENKENGMIINLFSESANLYEENLWKKAVHQFGHALGFINEDYAKCKDPSISDYGDSVMNYSYEIQSQKLSDKDKLELSKMYGPKENEILIEQTLNFESGESDKLKEMTSVKLYRTNNLKRPFISFYSKESGKFLSYSVLDSETENSINMNLVYTETFDEGYTHVVPFYVSIYQIPFILFYNSENPISDNFKIYKVNENGILDSAPVQSGKLPSNYNTIHSLISGVDGDFITSILFYSNEGSAPDGLHKKETNIYEFKDGELNITPHTNISNYSITSSNYFYSNWTGLIPNNLLYYGDEGLLDIFAYFYTEEVDGKNVIKPTTYNVGTNYENMIVYSSIIENAGYNSILFFKNLPNNKSEIRINNLTTYALLSPVEKTENQSGDVNYKSVPAYHNLEFEGNWTDVEYFFSREGDYTRPKILMYNSNGSIKAYAVGHP